MTPATLPYLSTLETPCYLFSPATVIEDYQDLRAALDSKLIVSFKANPLLDLFVRCSHAFVDGVELASLGELNVVVGRATIPKFVNTPALDRQLLSAALACRATIVLDSAAQVEMAIALNHAGLRERGVWLRLNAASLLENSRAGDRDHFGMDLRGALDACRRLHDAGIGVTGLHTHAGSNSFVRHGLALARAMHAAVGHVAAHTPQRVRAVNLGGGFPSDWRDADPGLERYREALAPLRDGLEVYHEAGRALFARAGSFVTRVQSVKHIDGRNIAVCDGGIAQAFLLAQTEQFVKQARSPRLLRADDAAAPAAADAAATPFQLVGNSCNRVDTIGQLDAGVVPLPGDLLEFSGCGAYHTYSPVKFLNLKPAKMYIAP